MIINRLTLEGEFVEAFIYFDFIWLISKAGETWAFDVAAYLEDHLSTDEFPDVYNIFCRNDQLDNNVYLVKSPLNIDISRKEVEKYSRIFATNIKNRSILDFRCYYGRGYVASESKVHQISMLGRQDLKHIANGVRANGQLGGDVVHDGRCVQFRCQFGIVSAACLGDGGLYAKGAHSDNKDFRADFKKFADRSTATEFIGNKVTNLPALEHIEFFGTKYSKISSTEKSSFDGTDEVEEKFIIEGVQEIDASLTQAAQSKFSTKNFGNNIDRIFLSKNYAFLTDFDRNLRMFKLAQNDIIDIGNISPVKGKTKDKILSMTSCKFGMIAEFDNYVSLFKDGNFREIYDDSIYSVRGYASSKWYKNLVTVVGSERSEVLSLST